MPLSRSPGDLFHYVSGEQESTMRSYLFTFAVPNICIAKYVNHFTPLISGSKFFACRPFVKVNTYAQKAWPCQEEREGMFRNLNTEIRLQSLLRHTFLFREHGSVKTIDSRFLVSCCKDWVLICLCRISALCQSAKMRFVLLLFGYDLPNHLSTLSALLD